MASSLDKIMKLRSLDEVLTRGGQAFDAYREQRRGVQVPSDEEFAGELTDEFAGAPLSGDSLKHVFFTNGDGRFFPAFADRYRSTGLFRELFGQRRGVEIVRKADDILGGRVDLLGLPGLYVGTDIDWHREPVSGKSAPLKHWKQVSDLTTEEIGDLKVLWELNRHQHFFTLGLAYWLTDDERYAEVFARHAETWMEQNPPGLGINWASSLEVSFRLMSWIWALHFFREAKALTSEFFKQVVKYLWLHGRHIERYLSTYYSPNTHLTGEGLGLFYLGTQLPFLKNASAWAALGENILLSEISRQVHADGVYFEQSTWYQRYTVDLYSHFVILQSLAGRSAEGEKHYDLESRLESAFEFLTHVTMPDGRTPLIGDDDGGRVLPLTGSAPDDFRGSIAVGAAMCGRADLKFAGRKVSEELFWLMGADGIASFRSLRARRPERVSAEFPVGGYWVMRDGWQRSDNCMIIDCGEVGSLSGGHGHADALAIEVALHGRTLLVDPGTYTYHESAELRHYFRSTGAHNTLTVDGQSSSLSARTFTWRTRAEVKHRNWISEERFDFFEGSQFGYSRMTDGVTHTRAVMFLKNDYWIIRDVAETTGEHEYALNFHYPADRRPEVGTNGSWVGESDHRIFTFNGDGRWIQRESWVSTNHGSKVNAPFMQFVSNGVGMQEFFTFILPANGFRPDVSEVVTVGGRAFLIRYSGYTDLFIYADPGKTIDSGMFTSSFRYTWARIRTGEELPDEIVLVDGGDMVIEGEGILKGPVSHSAMRRIGREIYLKTPEHRVKVMLPRSM